MICNKKLFYCLFIFLCFTILFAKPVKADLMGSTLSWQYYANAGAYSQSGGITNGSFTVNGGIGGTFIGNTGPYYFNIIADGSSITFDYSIATAATWTASSLSLGPTIYNGIAIDMVSGPAFTSVTIDSATNMVGFDTSSFSFTSSQIQVDWANLSFGPDTIVKLDINTVPEPTTILLLGLALMGFVGVRRMLQ
jgi:hypothetical protein